MTNQELCIFVMSVSQSIQRIHLEILLKWNVLWNGLPQSKQIHRHINFGLCVDRLQIILNRDYGIYRYLYCEAVAALTRVSSWRQHVTDAEGHQRTAANTCRHLSATAVRLRLQFTCSVFVYRYWVTRKREFTQICQSDGSDRLDRRISRTAQSVAVA